MSFLKSKFDLCVLELPKEFQITQGEAFNKLQAKKFKELTAAQEFGHGWTNMTDLFKDFSMDDTVVVNAVVGGYRFDKKKVPGALIKKLYTEKIKEKFNDGTGSKMTKEDKKILKQECKEQLLMQTLASPKMTTWIYDIDNQKVYLAAKSMAVVDTFVTLFGTTFDVSVTVKNYGLAEEDDLSDFLDYLWSNLSSAVEGEDRKGFWIDQEVTFDFDKNTFKFNGPRIEEYKEEIESFKKTKRIKSINVGMMMGTSEYSVTFNNKNMLLGVESLDKIVHEEVETAVIDNQDRIQTVMSQVEKLIETFKTN